MTPLTDRQQFDDAISHITQESHYVLSLAERFDWFVSQSKARRYAYSVQDLERYLYGRAEHPAQKERVLALLSIHPDPEARRLIERFLPDTRALRCFKRLALDERYDTDLKLIDEPSVIFCQLAPAWRCACMSSTRHDKAHALDVFSHSESCRASVRRRAVARAVSSALL